MITKLPTSSARKNVFNKLKKTLSIENLESRLNLSTLAAAATARWAGINTPVARQASTYNNINVLKMNSAGTSSATAATTPASDAFSDLKFGDTSLSSSSTTSVPVTSYSMIKGVQVEYQNGVPDIGWMQSSGVEMDYKLNVATAGNYQLNLGVAAPGAGSFDVYVNGAYSTTYSFSATGGWTSFKTVTNSVNLGTGSVTLAIVPKAGSQFNLQTISLTPPNGGSQAGVPITVGSGGATIGADQKSAISNASIEYQNGTPDVGYMGANGYVEYTLNVQTAGTYNIAVNTASPGSGSYLLSLNGSAAATYSFSSSGGWSSFKPVTNAVSLSAGTVVLRLANLNSSQYNTGSITITPSSGGGGTTSGGGGGTTTTNGGGGTTGGAVNVSTQWMTSFNQLNITGSSGNDSIYVSQSGNTINVTANGTTNSYTGPYGTIVIQSNGGNDTITVDSSVRLNTSVYGGSGNSNIKNMTQGLATVVTVGGGVNTIQGNGFNSAFWVNGSDTVNASGTENAAGAVHRVTSFWGGVSTVLAGQNLQDPTGTGTVTRVPNASFWGTGPTMSDINQGQVSDCFLLGPLQGLANTNPKALEEMAVDLGDGTYAVQFKRGGTTTYVRVDGDLPSSGYYANGLMYAHPGASGDIWAPIIEKAYAEFRTGAWNYNSLSYGNFGAVFADLGVGYTSFGAVDPNTMFNTIANGLNAGKIVVIGTNGNIVAGAPLVGTHTYTVTSAWRDSGGTGWVTLRNPWGFDGAGNDGNPGDALVTMTITQLQQNLQMGTVTV